MDALKYGVVMPVFDVDSAVKIAAEAENAGWDGFFMADGMWGLDTWICLSAAATQTERIRLGTLLTPLSIMRPWKLASQAATLDNLSNGRVTLTVGMGAVDIGFDNFGEATDLRTRAELVDEGLDIITKMWHSEPFHHKGKHYQIDLTDSVPKIPASIQKPRIPIWIVAAWPRPKSMKRTLCCDGIVPIVKPKGGVSRPVEPGDLQEIKNWIQKQQNKEVPFDYVIEGRTSGNEDKDLPVIQAWKEAGMTWWIESLWDAPPDERLLRMRQGPPHLE